MLAAHLASRVASAASWLLAAGFTLRRRRRPVIGEGAGVDGPGDGVIGGGSLPAGDDDDGSGGGGGGGGKGLSPSGVPGLMRPTPVHASVPPMRMVDRLRERAGLVSSKSTVNEAAAAVTAMENSQDGDAGSEGAVGNAGGAGCRGGVGDAPGAILVQLGSVLRDTFADAGGEEGFGEERGAEAQGSGLGNPALGEGPGCAAVRCLLEKGLAVVAYRYGSADVVVVVVVVVVVIWACVSPSRWRVRHIVVSSSAFVHGQKGDQEGCRLSRGFLSSRECARAP